jgi:hypothetical protein
MDKPEASTQELRMAIEQRLRNEETLEAIQIGLVQNGMDETLAKGVLAKIADGLWREEKKAWDRKLKSGGILFGVGAVITLGSYVIASGEGIYLLAWGPIIFGLIRCVEASSKSGEYRLKIKEVEQFQGSIQPNEIKKR